ncbi:glutaredoxin domain-containing cysteine-rich protein 1-like [Oscarella lobularis]|uniref:glutaredoxin domain-containing cysteine-rich protein 1-like n=1 Tax=Oscarella lobularis TaxID=121494 RepID=UPI0033140863
MTTIASTNRFSSSSDPCTDESDDGDLVADLPAFMTSSSSSSKREIRSKRGTVRGFENKVSTSLAALQKRATDETQSSRVLRLMEEERADADGRGGKIVVYMTSLSAVRETYQQCRVVLLTFRTHRVRVQQKDIMLHDEYHDELKERLGRDDVVVPQVFVNGHHVGGQTEVLALNEAGALAELLSSFDKILETDCRACGAKGFVPCMWCNGSKKSIRNRYGSLRCTVCNENGLQLCPECG